MACPDLAAYVDAVAVQHQVVAAACASAASQSCVTERGALTLLESKRESCAMGQNVGPVPRWLEPHPPGHGAPIVGSAELLAGGGLPIGNSVWRGGVGPNATLVGRGGASWKWIGGQLSAQYTHDGVSGGSSFVPTASSSRGIQSVRVLGNVTFDYRVNPWMLVSGRLGAGAELLFVGYRDEFQQHVTYEDTGLALELGGAVWFDVADVELGASVELPYASHSTAIQEEGLMLPSATYAAELLVGIRIVGK
ncbi:MAG TPA: hypothetical protein VLX92_24800 [Kofleriaceae bacterium]|nr:hypothetical protein [Kofleriaceae bacterium]